MPGTRIQKFLYCLLTVCVSLATSADNSRTKPNPNFEDTPGLRHERNFRTFLPQPGQKIESPATEVIQILLDRQDKGEFVSYMVQVLFHGRPASRNLRILDNRIVIDFFNTGKPANRLAKIRGGVVSSSLLEEFFYQDSLNHKKQPVTASSGSTLKKMVKLTLFMNANVLDLKIRDTLDRTLIHFRVPKSHEEKG